jgi:hypothetical protein
MLLVVYGMASNGLFLSVDRGNLGLRGIHRMFHLSHDRAWSLTLLIVSVDGVVRSCSAACIVIVIEPRGAESWNA